ncbi:MAG: hypothetical protein HONBIEJF_00909 [Fimbriimonadaceae bacterium]|nr:hypothetical protein [Fimbriimonadaceae bacterium]
MNSVLDRAIDFLRTEIRPRALAIDASPDEVRRAFHDMGRHDLLALRRPADFGGPAMSELDFRRFQVEAARASGTFAFLQTQHQTAVGMIAKGGGGAAKARLLPKMSTGNAAIGIGFSQLRRGGDPICRATPDGDGYRIDGHVPWVTGWSIFDSYILGAALPSGESVFGICPLPTESTGTMKISEPMRLAAMESAQTVTMDLTDWRMASSEVVFVQPPGWAQKNDEVNIALQGFFALGCAHAGVDIVDNQAAKKANPRIDSAAEGLRTEVRVCQEEMERLAVEGEAETKLRLRAWAIDLAVRCAHAAIAATGGSANSIANDAQRVYREALVFTVSAQTPPIMEATLDRLVRDQAEFMEFLE